MDSADEEQERLRVHKQDQDDLSISVLELLGKIIAACAFVGPAGTRPQHGEESLLLKGDNMSAIHWVNRCEESTECRSGVLVRILGCLETDSGWSFRVKHVAGIGNTLADCISRWQRASINVSLLEFQTRY